MIIQATPYGTKKEDPFAFTYSGDFTDSRVDGIGDVTLNTSGTLIVTGQAVTVSVYILAGGGGVWWGAGVGHVASGGGGGNQTVEITLEPGTYEIIIGAGGAGVRYSGTESGAGNGGDTLAFGYASTGGQGGYTTKAGYIAYTYGGVGGTPNGGAGTQINSNNGTAAGGSPNGGGYFSSFSANSGGNGLVRITFS